MNRSQTAAAQTAAREALARYCVLIDERRLEDLREVFTVDCRVQFGDQSIEGFAALLSYLRKGLEPFAATRHVVSDVALDSEAPADSAGPYRFTSRVVAWHEFVVDRPSLTLFGRYRDVLVETNEGWRITEHVGSEIRREHGSAPPSGGHPRSRFADRDRAVR